MKILALIPARGGSKRIPRKNIRRLGKKPLIIWSIDVAKGVPEICDILVSTDDVEIAEISKAAGANVPWLRPLHLATDVATTIDVCMHALEWYEKEHGHVDGLLLLQPTSPLRTKKIIKEGIKLFASAESSAIIGFSLASAHPNWCFKFEENKIIPYIDSSGFRLRSQDLQNAYIVDGSFYLASPSYLKKNQSFYGQNIIPLINSEPLITIDIDDEWDWFLAEKYLEYSKDRP